MKDSALNSTDLPSFSGTRTGLALAVRDRLFRHGIHTVETHEEQQARRVAYLSAEYLPGPHLGLNLLNLGVTEQARQALSQLGYDLDDLVAPNNGDKELFRPVVDNLLLYDPFFLLADYQSYVDCQNQVSAMWADQAEWTRKSILNVARMGKFSADRSIDDYCERIWKIEPVHVHVG